MYDMYLYIMVLHLILAYRIETVKNQRPNAKKVVCDSVSK